MAERRVVAGTIMVTNAQGESYFLVEKNEEKLSFLSDESIKDGRLPMGIIMAHLLKFVNVDPDSLRLMDLAQLKADNINIPLFVFDLVERPETPDDLLSLDQNVVWRRSKEITSLLDSYDFGIIPIY